MNFTKYATTGQVFAIQAPEGKLISITRAKYGSPYNGIYLDCNSKIKELCEGKSYCQTLVSDVTCSKDPFTAGSYQDLKVTGVYYDAPQQIQPQKRIVTEPVKEPISEPTKPKVTVSTATSFGVFDLQEQIRREKELEDTVKKLGIASMILLVAGITYTLTKKKN